MGRPVVVYGSAGIKVRFDHFVVQICIHLQTHEPRGGQFGTAKRQTLDPRPPNPYVGGSPGRLLPPITHT